jgi:hypothetical protein
MKEENGMDNFLSFVYHAEENRIHSAVPYSGKLMTEADVQYAKKIFRIHTTRMTFSMKKSDGILFN